MYILYGNVNNIIHNHWNSFDGVDRVQLSNFLPELIMLRDTKLTLSNNVYFSKAELEYILHYVHNRCLIVACIA